MSAWSSMGWCASGAFLGGAVAVPLVILWPQINKTAAPGQPAPEPVAVPAAIILPAIAPPEVHSAPWFVEHQNAIVPERTKCGSSTPTSAAAAAQCANADRASLHVFNQELRAKYFGGK